MNIEQIESNQVGTNIPIAIVGSRTVSALPSESVDFPAIRVVVDMWRIVKSAVARPATIREAFGA